MVSITRSGGDTSSITFNTSQSAVITNVIYTTTNALGIQEKPFTGPDIVQDLGLSDILVFVTGFLAADNTTDIGKIRDWMIEAKTHVNFPYGRFSLDMVVDVFDKTADLYRGYILYDGLFTEESDPHRISFTLRFRFSGTSWS